MMLGVLFKRPTTNKDNNLQFNLRMGSIFFLSLLGLVLLMACASQRYEEGSPPHESWKLRGEYCFAVEVDPRGERNSVYFWADDLEVITNDDSSAVRAKDVRVSTSDDNDDDGNPKRDYYSIGKTEIIEDGTISVEERCFE